MAAMHRLLAPGAVLRLVGALLLAPGSACAGRVSSPAGSSDASSEDDAGDVPSESSAQDASSGGTAASEDAGTAADSGAASTSLARDASASSDAGAVNTKPDLPAAMGTPGVWENVTSPEMDPALFTGPSGFGVGNIVVDPAQPTDVYAGGYGSIWKSSDYGLTWKKLDAKPNPPSIPLGHVLAVAGTKPATLWMANASGGPQFVYKSTDGGLSFRLTGTVAAQSDVASFYSIVVDPYDPTHLLTGLHEQDRLLESTDGGESWKLLSGSGWPSGGKSWFPFFIDTGAPDTTRQTWFAIAQDGGSAVKTSDGGKSWVKPQGIEGLQHPHGCASLFQRSQTLFVAGVSGPGAGVYRSTDRGDHFMKVAQDSGGLVWGSPKNVYAMWGWACASCGLKEGGPQYQTAAQPGDTWMKPSLPAGLVWGPNSVATTSDGKHTIFVGSMWATGLWRYVEP